MNLINRYPLKTRLLIIVLLAFLCSSIILVFLINSVEVPMRAFERIGEDSVQLKNIETLVDDARLDIYEVDNNEIDELRLNYQTSKEKLKNEVHSSDMYFTGYESYYKYEGIMRMVEAYIKTLDEAFEYYDAGDSQKFVDKYYAAETIRSYISVESEKLIVQLYSESDEIRETISRQLRVFSIVVPIVIALLGIMLASLVLAFRKWVTNPLNQMEKVATDISKGIYYKEKIDFGNDEELNTLSDAMFSMSGTIEASIKELENKQELTEQLHKRDIENLQMKADYNRLELQRLQEKINPHFLFNILSTLQHTAFIEKAQKTCDLTNSIAKLLRYSLEESKSIVSLDEELKALQHYLTIQEERFGDRIKIRLTYPDKIPDVELPGLSLQPLVENCYSHGLENTCTGGEIAITIEEKDNQVLISIVDNGCGMSNDMLEEYKNLFALGRSDTIPINKIGLWNVVNRLQIYFGKKDIVEISSNHGFKIQLKLPMDDMEEL